MSQVLVPSASIVDPDVKEKGMELAEQELAPDTDDPQFTPEFEKKFVRKLDRLLIPASMLLYLFSALDRGNLGNIRLLGLIGDRGLSADPDGQKYALLVAMFYIGYSSFIIPSGLLSKRLSRPYVQVSISAFIWGTAAVCSGAVNTWAQAYGLRFLLAVGEAGYQPTVGLMLAKWYSRDELALRFSFFYSTGAFAGVVNGLIAYGLNFSKSSVAPWRLLYIIDGCTPIALAFYSWWTLPADISNTKRLTAEEKTLALVRLHRRGTPENHQIRWRQMITVLWSWPILLPAVTNMCGLLVNAVVSVFLPTLINQAGYSGALAQIYTLPGYGSAFIMMLLCAYLSDKTGRRGPFVIFGFALMTIGCAMVAAISPTLEVSRRNGRFAGLTLVSIGSLIIIPLNQVWVAENSGNENRRSAGLPLFMALGQAAAAASGYMFPANQAPTYKAGSYACLGLSVCGLAVSIAYVVICLLVNAHRDRKEGKPDPSAIPDTSTYADQAKGFRYRW